MYYVMSDLHGEYDKYMAMLNKINFNDDDTLFILGDVLDRGEKPLDILNDMMTRFNVYPLLGNHELMALSVLEKLCVEITENNYNKTVDEDIMMQLMDWQMNGGQKTLSQFQTLSKEEKYDIIDYLHEFSLYDVIDVNDKSYILVHAGLGHYNPHKKMKDYTLEDLLWTRPNFDEVKLPDENTFIICEHTPTLAINGQPNIYQTHQHIYIDCGACFKGGKLACLCLDTMEEFYV